MPYVFPVHLFAFKNIYSIDLQKKKTQMSIDMFSAALWGGCFVFGDLSLALRKLAHKLGDLVANARKLL